MKYLADIHFIFHPIINYLVSISFGIPLNESLLISFAGIIIDIDHTIYYLYIFRNLSISQYLKWTRKEYASHQPHFFIFHTIEVILFLIVLGNLYSRLLLLFGMGFLLHFIIDILAYSIYYKSLKPWYKYLSFLTYYF